MPRVQLTDAAVKAAKAESGQRDLWDETVRGLVLRVYESGRKVWHVYYRREDGRRRFYRLKPYPDLGLKEARKQALGVLGRVAERKDPQGERERARAAGPIRTVADLAEEFMRRYSERNNRERSVQENRDQLDRYVLPAWRRRLVTEIARRDVRRLLEDLADGTIAKRGEPTTSAPRALRALLSKMFGWAVEQEILPANPAAGVELPVRPGTRERVLSEDEIRLVWKELAAMDVENPLSAAAFRLLLLTAQRPGEVLGMRWAEVDGSWWTIPPERHKGDRTHRVPLSPQALAALERVEGFTGEAEHVFDSPYKPGQPLSTLKTANHGIRRRAKMARWTPHDLRRTAATHLTSGGTPRLVVERILGHAEHGVAAVYDRSSYDREKRRALLWWGRKVEQIAAAKGTKKHKGEIVPMAAAGE